MGKCLSKKSKAILVIGLSGSGKSTIINYFNPKNQREIVATVGYQVEIFKHENLKLTIFDMSGDNKYRGLWENYYDDIHGIIFVIDSADKEKIEESKEQL